LQNTEDVLLDIKDKLDKTLLYIYKKYNVEQHTKVACEILKKRWQNFSQSLFVSNNLQEVAKRLLHHVKKQV